MIIVTGATGFIGSNLIADLNESGRSDLILVDDLGSDSKWKNIAKRRFDDLVSPVELESLLNRLPGAEAVFHLGANSSTTATDGDAIWQSNWRASKQLWAWCVRTHTPLIYASSAATYGDGKQGFMDDQSLVALDALRPLNLYGWSKHAFDKWAIEQHLAGQAPPQWCGLKFFNVYGPNEHHKGDMRSLVCKNTPLIVANQTISLFKSHRVGFDNGEQLRDFVYVKDCTRVMLWLLDNPQVSGLFNLGTGKARSFRELMLCIGVALDKSVSITYVDMPDSIRPNYQYFTQAEMSKLIRAGYTSEFHSLEAGVADYVRSYLTQADSYR